MACLEKNMNLTSDLFPAPLTKFWLPTNCIKKQFLKEYQKECSLQFTELGTNGNNNFIDAFSDWIYKMAY